MSQILERLRSFVKEQPFYEKVLKGHVNLACKSFSDQLGYAITVNKDLFPNLSILMVTNQAFTDHAWLLYHHPDIGFGMIDPTAGQFLENSSQTKSEYKQYKDVFIGTREELGILALEYGIQNWQQEYWTPAMLVQNIALGANPQLFDSVFREIWDKHPLTIDRTLLGSSTERMARLAARYEEAGLDWREAYLKDCQKSLWKKTEELENQIREAEMLIDKYRNNKCQPIRFR